MPEAKLISITLDAVDLIKEACSMPYGKDISNKALESIITSGHLSVLEHCSASFRVKCSVAVLSQITRHRHLSFTVKSARGSRFDTFVNPIKACNNEAALAALNLYDQALELGMPEQDARYWLPQGVMTEFVVTGNFRAWFEYLPKRLCKRAMHEHRELAKLIYEELKMYCPKVFDRDFMNCKNCTETRCSFK